MTDQEIAARFKDHVAKLLPDGAMTFRDKNGSSIYYVKYRVDGQFLIVLGDIGEAIFQWSSAVNFEWAAGCDNHYILGKCQASASGRSFTDWCRETCVTKTMAYLGDHLGGEGLTYEEIEGVRAECEANAGSKDEWLIFLHDNRSDNGHLSKLIDGDCGICDIGDVPSIAFRSMMIGLRLAVAQLAANPARMLLTKG